ncbi:MAG: ATP-dependent sacrificial sulfur transferase LarE [bacterium JZ-2024 1]
MEEKLQEIFLRYSSAVVAFSGGVDSAVVAWCARKFLNGKVLLVTVLSPAVPEWDIVDAKRVASFLSLPHRFVLSDVVEKEEYRENSPFRCYYCKRDIYGRLEKIREEEGCEVILNGETEEDRGDFRPGGQAAEEFHVVSPLKLAGLFKSDVRKLARKAGLPVADKPSSPCLSSRIPFFQPIDAQRLKRVEEAERRVRSLGFQVVRVRDFFPTALLEFLPEEIPLARNVLPGLKALLFPLGYSDVSISSRGYKPMGLQFLEQKRSDEIGS